MKNKVLISIVAIVIILMVFYSGLFKKEVVVYEYENEYFHLKLQLPDDWQDYKTTSGSTPDGQTSITFFLPTADKEYPTDTIPGYEAVFAIDIFSKPLWEMITSSCQLEWSFGCVRDGEQIINSDDFYVLFSPAVGGPSDFVPARGPGRAIVDRDYLQKKISFTQYKKWEIENISKI